MPFNHSKFNRAIDFVSFEDVEERFEQDWIALRDRV
jgi:hypothetical protein